MIKILHEEYTNITGGLPFVMNCDLTRTPTVRSEQQNWHDNIEIQLCQEGEGTVLIDGKRYDFHKNIIAVIDSNAIHYTCSDTTITYSCIIVGVDFCRQMGIDYDALSFVPIIESRILADIFKEMCHVYKSDAPMRIARLSKLLLELLIEITENHSSEKKQINGGEKGLNAVKKAIIYMRENFHRDICLEDIAKSALTDKYTLCKTFKNRTGQTVFEYLNIYRCTKAAEYLSDGKRVLEAAYLCGFENASFFTKIFKRYMGVLPSKYNGYHRE